MNFDAGVAHYGLANVAMADYGTLANALFGKGVGLPGDSVPSTVSWSLNLHTVLSTGSFRDDTVGFAMDYKQTEAHLEWSMREKGFSFTAEGSHQFSSGPLKPRGPDCAGRRCVRSPPRRRHRRGDIPAASG